MPLDHAGDPDGRVRRCARSGRGPVPVVAAAMAIAGGIGGSPACDVYESWKPPDVPLLPQDGEPMALPTQPYPSPPSGVCAGRTDLPPLVEDRHVYDQDDLHVSVIRLTVPDLTALAAVNANEPDAQAAANFQADNYTADPTALNATLEIRGRSTRRARQKSYKIKLEGAPEWRGQKTIHLNKHPFDLTRVRNKLSFDYFKLIPDFASLRTLFVHLYINGEDMGLFTAIEHVNGRYPMRRGLSGGSIYKAQNFAFGPIHPDVVKDDDMLDEIVEDAANADLDKLLRMIRDVNDVKIPINEVITAHFNFDNYLTWLAVNFLMGNFDTVTQNFFLYSPVGCEGWYFIPWDYDGAWGYYEQPDNTPRYRWQEGPSNWWSPILHRRFFREPGNLALVEAKMEQLRDTVITESRTRAFLDSYREVVRPFVEVRPDLYQLPVDDFGMTPAEWIAQRDVEYDRLPSTIAAAHQQYLTARERPTPYWLSNEAMKGKQMLHWNPSFDFQGDAITYDLEVATDPAFAPETVVARRTGIPHDVQAGLISTTAPSLPGGTYRWRILARDSADPANHWQAPFGEGFRDLKVGN